MTTTDEWHDMQSIPKDGTIVIGLMSDGTTRDIYFHENYYRATIMIREGSGQFWRYFPVSGPRLTHWKYDNNGEIEARNKELDNKIAKILKDI